MAEKKAAAKAKPKKAKAKTKAKSRETEPEQRGKSRAKKSEQETRRQILSKSVLRKSGARKPLTKHLKAPTRRPGSTRASPSSARASSRA